MFHKIRYFIIVYKLKGINFYVFRYLDLINVMTYNFYGPWSQYTGHNSPLYPSSIETAYEKANLNVNISIINWLNAGVPKEKIMVGVPFYGRRFTLLNETINGLHAPFNKSKTGSCTYKTVSIPSYGILIFLPSSSVKFLLLISSVTPCALVKSILFSIAFITSSSHVLLRLCIIFA